MRKELEIYIHIPFCVQKCKYCDFLSGPATVQAQDQYMEALLKEIKQRSCEFQEYVVSSVFIGGGTPSCVNPRWIVKVMKLVKSHFHICEDAEISMEMNPGTVNRAGLEAYHVAGINRLSIGLQSARKDELICLGRIHSYEQFLEAYFTAREIGFLNINVDVMSGLPKQDLEGYMETLQKITGLNPPPEHISAYSLIIEEGTPFYEAYEQDKLELPDEETDRAMYEETRTFLQKKGYERYEISNYAKKGYECRHNVGYWQRKNYIGFGIGAASLVENTRFRNGESIEEYLKDPCACRCDVEEVSVKEQMEEMLFLGLRMTGGVSYQAFEDCFGTKMDAVYVDVISKHVMDGLLEIIDEPVIRSKGLDGRMLRLTKKGMDVSNYVMADFLEP